MEITAYGRALVKTDDFAKAVKALIRDFTEKGDSIDDVVACVHIYTAAILCADENRILRNGSEEAMQLLLEDHHREVLEALAPIMMKIMIETETAISMN